MNRRLSAALLCLILLCAPAAAPAEEAPWRIACIIPMYQEIRFWQDIHSGIKQAAADYGVHLSLLYTRHNEPALSLSLDDALSIAILSDVDAIVTSYTLATEETDRLLESAREAGIFVIMLDCDAPKALRDIYVGIDNQAAGVEIGESVLSNLAPGESALLVYSKTSIGSKNLIERLEGIELAFADTPDVLATFVLEDSTTVRSVFSISTYLEENPSVSAIIAINENSTLVCAQAADRISPQRTILRYGFDESDETLSYLDSGNLSMLICQPNSKMGYTAIETAVALLEGESFSSDIVPIDYIPRVSGD